MKALANISSHQKSFRKFPVNLRPHDEWIFKNEKSYEINAKRLLKVPLVIFDHNGMTKKISFNPQYLDGSEQSFSGRNLLMMLVKFKIRVYWSGTIAIHKWHDQYFHWITEILPKLFTLENEGNNVLLIPAELQKFQQEGLSILNINVKTFSRHFYHFGINIKYMEPFASPGNYNESILQKFRKAFFVKMNLHYTPNSKKIAFVSRKKIGTRDIQNEDELFNMVKEFDGDKIVFENSSWLEQVKLINTYSIIIGFHGAGLVNMVFMPDKTKVLEIRDQFDDKNNCYFSLASAFNFDYYYCLATKVENEKWEVPKVEFKKVLEQIQNCAH